jgi:hypothetical protein
MAKARKTRPYHRPWWGDPTLHTNLVSEKEKQSYIHWRTWCRQNCNYWGVSLSSSMSFANCL